MLYTVSAYILCIELSVNEATAKNTAVWYQVFSEHTVAMISTCDHCLISSVYGKGSKLWYSWYQCSTICSMEYAHGVLWLNQQFYM